MCRYRLRFAHVALVLLLLTFAAPSAPALSQSSDGSVIAVVTDQQAISLFTPSGTAVGTPFSLPPGIPAERGLGGLAWSPEANRILFTRADEFRSLFLSDIWSVRFDGQDLRRITNPRNPDELGGLPRGDVLFELTATEGQRRNIFVYMEGMDRVEQFTVEPMVTRPIALSGVADFGPGVPQRIQLFDGDICVASRVLEVDVLPNGLATLPERYLWRPLEKGRCPRAIRPMSHIDGRVGYLLQNQPFSTNPLYPQTEVMLSPANPAWGDRGATAMTFSPANQQWDVVTHAVLGPTPTTANEVVYAQGPGIYRASLSNPSRPITLYRCPGFTVTCRITALTWLPNGSGVLFAAESLSRVVDDASRVYRHDFASQRTIPIFELPREYLVDLTVSPDGREMAFARGQSASGPWSVWKVGTLGGSPSLVARGARAPAWSPKEPSLPFVFTMPAIATASLPVVSGKGTPGHTVRLTVSWTALASTTDADGMFPDSTALAASGAAEFVTAIDGSGNWSVSMVSAAPVSGQLPAGGFPRGTVVSLRATGTSPAGQTSGTIERQLSIGWGLWLPLLRR